MEDKDYILIENYWENLLDEQQKTQVLQRVQNEPAFAAAFEEMRQMQEWLRSEPLRKAFQETTETLGQAFFGAESDRETGSSPAVGPSAVEMTVKRGGQWTQKRYWWAIAASLAALIAVMWLFYPSADPDLYRRYALHTPPQWTVRSGDNPEAAVRAETAFKRGDYQAALTALEAYAKAKPEDPSIAFYQAVCLIEINRAAEARALLQPLATGQSAWRDEARWYLALSWLKEKNMAESGKALSAIQPGEDHYQEASALLKLISK
jgi:predicted Zn-dependent protease